MPQLYETYGPFSLDGDDSDFLGRPSSDFWEQVEDQYPGLSTAIGVYVIAARDKKGRSVPWYVGMTERGFEGRLAQHRSTFAAIAKKCGECRQEVFFVARRKLVRDGFVTAGKTPRLGITSLETRLIETCLKRNPSLHNDKKIKSMTDTCVPGYTNDKPGKRSKAASLFNDLVTGNTKAG